MRRAALAILLVLTTSCSDGLLFRIDERLAIVTPDDRATVRLPVTVRWRFDSPDAVRYAVFVDQAPMPPGKTVEHLEDDAVRATLTDDTSFVLETVNPRENVSDAERDRHEIVVVLLDDDGRRIGETAAYVEITVRRSR